MGATLGPNRASVMDPWERPMLVSQVVVSRRAKELCSSGVFVVLVETVDVTPRDPARKSDSRRAPIHREAYTRARLRKAGINQHSGSQAAHILILQVYIQLQ
jgi:hypothetical protein